MLVVSTAFVRAALGGGGLEISLNSIGILTAMHNVIPRAYARFVQESFGKGAAVHGHDASELVDHSPTMHCGTALILTIVEVVGRLGISNSDANQWALDNEGHRRKELRFMLDSLLQRLAVLRLVCEPLRHLLSAKYDLSSNALAGEAAVICISISCGGKGAREWRVVVGVCHEHAREQGFGKGTARVGVLVRVGSAARVIDEEGGRVGFRVHQLESLGMRW